MAKRKRKRRPVVMAALIAKKHADRSFDLVFWRCVGAEGRFAAAWQMLREFDLMRGGDGNIPRLQRSVARFEKRESPVSRRRRTRRDVLH
ncbi:MAG: hypothetical protein IT449_17085 [Phycisphaerales bacterium]|nr:hypothetical protein [Phycisphaerales bacterium]